MARRRVPIAGSAPTAASSIARPPRPWTSTSDTPSRAALATAPATVFGMSWNLRSRNTFSPCGHDLADELGAGGGEELAADLEHADVARQPLHERAGVVGLRHVEGHDQAVAGVHALPLPSQRSSPRPDTRACPPPGVDVVEPVPLEIVAEPVQDALVDAGVDEVRGADLHRAAARDQELERVLGGGDAADPDHRDLDRARRLPGHPHRDRPDGGPGEPAGAEAEPRPPRLDVDREAEQRVDAGERVGARLLGGAGEHRDVGDVRRELGDDGQPRRLAHRGHHLVRHARVAAEGHPALLHVRAGDVDLEAGDAAARRRRRARPRRTPRPCRRTRSRRAPCRGGAGAAARRARRRGCRRPAGRSRSAGPRASPRCAASGRRRAARGRGPSTRGRRAARGRGCPRTRRRSRRCPRPRSAGS